MAEETYEPNQTGSVNPETEPKADVPGVAEKRKPGRPAKAAPVVDNVSTNYQPSVERNEVAMAAQPTGTGSVSGWLRDDELVDTNDVWRGEAVVPRMAGLVAKENDSPPPIGIAPETDRPFPVRLLRNYVPRTERWAPMLRDGRAGRKPQAVDSMGNVIPEGLTKVDKGFTIFVPVSEAKELIERGLAVRADDLPL